MHHIDPMKARLEGEPILDRSDVNEFARESVAGLDDHHIEGAATRLSPFRLIAGPMAVQTDMTRSLNATVTSNPSPSA